MSGDKKEPTREQYAVAAKLFTRALTVTPLAHVTESAVADLRAALCNVPPSIASGDMPRWIVRLHRAACEVAGVGARDGDTADYTEVGLPPAFTVDARRRGETGSPPGQAGIAMRATSAARDPRRPPAACSRCGSPIMYSARQRGDGLCGPCHRKATGTQGLPDRCRDAGIEPSLVQELVLEILRSPEGRGAIAEVINDPLIRNPDGTCRELSDCIKCGSPLEGGGDSGVRIRMADGSWSAGRAHLRCASRSELSGFRDAELAPAQPEPLVRERKEMP